MLQACVDYLNELTGQPALPWTQTENGLKANVGNYHISGAYGGFCLYQMTNEYGRVTTPLFWWHGPKRKLFNALNAFIEEIEAGKAIA